VCCANAWKFCVRFEIARAEDLWICVEVPFQHFINYDGGLLPLEEGKVPGAAPHINGFIEMITEKWTRLSAKESQNRIASPRAQDQSDDGIDLRPTASVGGICHEFGQAGFNGGRGVSANRLVSGVICPASRASPLDERATACVRKHRVKVAATIAPAIREKASEMISWQAMNAPSEFQCVSVNG